MTASRLNDAGFCRGGNFWKFADLLRHQRLHPVDDRRARSTNPSRCSSSRRPARTGRAAGGTSWALSASRTARTSTAVAWRVLHEHDLPVPHPNGEDVAVVADIEEELRGLSFASPGQVGQHVDAVDVDLVGLLADLMALEQLGGDVRSRRRPRAASAASPDG